MSFEPEGTLAWETQLDDARAGLHVNDVVVDSAGAIIIAGQRQPGITQYDGYVVKLSSTGSQLWDENIVGNGYEEVFAVTVLDDDSLVFTGSYSEVPDSSDTWVARLTP